MNLHLSELPSNSCHQFALVEVGTHISLLQSISGLFLDNSGCSLAGMAIMATLILSREGTCRCKRAKLDAATCGHVQHKVWRWHKEALACNVRRVTSKDLTELLQDQWFAVVGDSVGRNLFAAFLRLVADEGAISITSWSTSDCHQDAGKLGLWSTTRSSML